MVAVNRLHRAEELQGETAHFDLLQVLAERLTLLEAEVSRLRTSLATLEALERYRDMVPLAETGGELALHRTCVIEALDFIQAGAGFHHLEYSPSGIPYRWTGPGPSSHLTLWLDRSRPIIVRISMHAFGAAGEDAPILIDVDNKTFTAEREAGSSVIVAGPVQPRTAPGPTHLVIHAPQMFSPSQAGGTDVRMLGVALSRIELLPA
jgi:hypothetical protein